MDRIHYPLLSNRSIGELSTLGVVDSVGKDLLKSLRHTLLHSLGHLGVASGVRDLASLLVAAGVVERVGDLLLDA